MAEFKIEAQAASAKAGDVSSANEEPAKGESEFSIKGAAERSKVRDPTTYTGPQADIDRATAKPAEQSKHARKKKRQAENRRIREQAADYHALDDSPWPIPGLTSNRVLEMLLHNVRFSEPQHRRRSKSAPTFSTRQRSSSVSSSDDEGGIGSEGTARRASMVQDSALSRHNAAPSAVSLHGLSGDYGQQEVTHLPEPMNAEEMRALPVISIGAMSDCIRRELGEEAEGEEVGYGRAPSRSHTVFERPVVTTPNCTLYNP